MEEKPLIYILTSQSFPGYVKIGKTTDLPTRLKSLNDASCLPFRFRVYATYKVEKDLDTVEKIIHDMIDMIDYSLRAREEIDSKRVREREFFELDKEKAYEFLRGIAILRGDEHNLEMPEKTSQEKAEDKDAEREEKLVKRQKRLPFSEYGIPIGSKIAFFDNEAITATVINEWEVEYEGEKYKLSRLAAELLKKYRGQKTDNVRGQLYFTYKGKRISELRPNTPVTRGLTEDTSE